MLNSIDNFFLNVSSGTKIQKIEELNFHEIISIDCILLRGPLINCVTHKWSFSNLFPRKQKNPPNTKVKKTTFLLEVWHHFMNGPCTMYNKNGPKIKTIYKNESSTIFLKFNNIYTVQTNLFLCVVLGKVMQKVV